MLFLHILLYFIKLRNDLIFNEIPSTFQKISIFLNTRYLIFRVWISSASGDNVSILKLCENIESTVVYRRKEE